MIHVLHIEDSDEYAHAVAAYSPNIECTRARDLAAVRLMQGGAFDGILLDLELPDSRGVATYATVSALFPHIPVLVLSGTMADSVELANVEHVAKTSPRVREVLYGWLDRLRAQKEILRRPPPVVQPGPVTPTGGIPVVDFDDVSSSVRQPAPAPVSATERAVKALGRWLFAAIGTGAVAVVGVAGSFYVDSHADRASNERRFEAMEGNIAANEAQVEQLRDSIADIGQNLATLKGQEQTRATNTVSRLQRIEGTLDRLEDRLNGRRGR